MKPDEKSLWIAIKQKPPYQSVRDLVVSLNIPAKRAAYILEKWSSRGWYDYGVSVDLGWLTSEGEKRASEVSK